MLIYILNLFIVFFAAFLARKSKSKFVSRFLLGIAFTSMVLVAGLRSRYVGTDSSTYVGLFGEARTFTDAMNLGTKMWEHGFWTLTWLVHFVSDEYMALFFAIALITVGCYQTAIVAYSESIEISFFVYIAMGFYPFFFNGARQGIACAICCLAIGEILKKNFIKYLAYVLVATLFHKTAIMMIPVYFILTRPNTFKNNLVTFAIGGIVVLFIDSIIGFASSIDNRYSSYGNEGEGGGYYMFVFNVVLGLCFFMFKNSIRINRYEYDRLLNMFLFGVMVGMVSAFLHTDPSGLLRFGEYFNLSAIFMWPIIFKNLRDRLLKFVVGYSFVMFYLVFFVMTTTRFSNYTPYIFNPIISNLFK